MRAAYISTGLRKGTWNMALDRLLMELVGSGKWDLVLRTYGWEPACVSIGKLQKTRREVNRRLLLSRGYGLVRRPTGGRAVWHETEVTYSIVAPLTHPAVSGTISEALRKTSFPMVKALRGLGVPARTSALEKHLVGGPRMEANPCFTSHGKWEIGTPDGRKLVGSAQARSRGVFLEHGSILLENDQPKILDYLPEDIPSNLRKALMVHLEEGIATLREFRPDLEAADVEGALLDSFSESLSTEMEPLVISDLDCPRLRELERQCADDV